MGDGRIDVCGAAYIFLGQSLITKRSKTLQVSSREVKVVDVHHRTSQGSVERDGHGHEVLGLAGCYRAFGGEFMVFAWSRSSTLHRR